MDYKERLRQWNSTEKYRDEVDLLFQLISAYAPNRVLDYGCGIGTAMHLLNRFNKFKVFGFDVNKYIDTDLFYDNDIKNTYDHVYFLHSISHIENIKEVILKLKTSGCTYRPAITVITPNASWLDPGYKSDPTVIKHYTQSELKELFVSCGYEVTLLGQFGEEKNGINERIFLQAK